MRATRPRRTRRFWGWAIVIAVAAVVVLIEALSLTPTVFSIQGVGQCIDYTEESGMRSTCTESVRVGAGVWYLAGAGLLVVAYFVYRLVKARPGE